MLFQKRKILSIQNLFFCLSSLMAAGLLYLVIGITHTPDRSSMIVMDVFLLFMVIMLAIEEKKRFFILLLDQI